MATTIPMLSPDGTSGDIPQDRVQDAAKAGFKRAYEATAPDGKTKGYIPGERLPDALASGFNLTSQNQEGRYQVRTPGGKTVGLPYSAVSLRPQGYVFATQKDQDTFNQDFAADPAQKNDDTPSLRKPLTWTERMKAAVQHPINSLDQAAQPVHAPRDASAGEQADATLANVGAGAAQVIRHPIQTAETALAAITPQPLIDASERKFKEENPGAPVSPEMEQIDKTPNPIQGAYQALNTEPEVAIPNAIGNAAATAGIVRGGGAAVDAIPAVSDWKAANAPVPGENYTPIQHKAMSGVLARGTGMGKDYFPRDVAQTIMGPVRQAAADNPELASAIQRGAPDDAMGAFQAILGKAKEKIDIAHSEALDPVRNSPFDPAEVQKAIKFPKSLEGFSPSDAKAIEDLRQRLGTVKTLEGANELRKWLNNELAPEFRKNAVAAGRSGAVDQAYSDARAALRPVYYEHLEKASGKDFSDLKRTEGGIIAAQESMQNAAPSLASKEAIATEPKGAKGMIADALKGARTMHGGPISGAANIVAERALGATPLGEIQQGLQRALSKLPSKSAPAAPPVPRPSPAQLPADVPGNAPYGPEPQAGGTGAPAPATVTPAPRPQSALPAVSSPDGVGVPPDQPPTAPPLNAATATESMRPPLAPNPQPTPPGRTVVTPEGTAIPQRPQLPAPIKAPRSGKTVGIGDTVSVNGRTGTVRGVNAKTGRIEVQWQ